MGADRYLYVDVGQENVLIARVDPSVYFRENETVRIGVQTLKAHFFHQETGERFSE
jgi:multiple sugar transport system ATP-binding protein